MRSVVGFLALLFCFPAFAASAGKVPTCLDDARRPMRIDNSRVLDLKRTTRSGYHDRGFVRGPLLSVVSTKGSHVRLDVYIGPEGSEPRGAETSIELVYNRAFGQLGNRLEAGMDVVACGDFVNAFKQNGRYPPSPLGAIIHWLHMSPRPNHVSGFLMIDGKLFGQHNPNDRPGLLGAFSLPAAAGL